MSAHKRLLQFVALAILVVAASASVVDAQGSRRRAPSARGGGAPRVLEISGYYADPFWYGDPWYGYQYPMGPYRYPSPYRHYGFDEAAVRIEVTPRDAQVYVDGYYAGIVDDFDGAFQRLRVEPGEHEIAIYLEGHRSFRQNVYLTPDNTFRLKHALLPLAAGEQPEPRPEPLNPPPSAQGQPPTPPGQPPQGTPMPRGPVGRRMPFPPPQGTPGNPPPRGGDAASAYGTLAIRVQPADAEVSIDGENWRGPGGQDRLVIEVSEGSHTVEIRKSGYRTYVTQVEIRRGETTPLNVSLRGDQ